MTAQTQTASSLAVTRAPSVSVIIPAYMVAPYIAATLDSVLAQSFKDYEVIVVNDGSPDTAELERALAPYLERITYVRQENRGAGAARNNGLRRARGRYVAFLDGDDLWLPDFLSEMVALVESEGGYDLVYADAMLFGDSPLAGTKYTDTCPSVGAVTLESLLAERCHVITSGVLARREPIMEVGLFDESLKNSQDFDLWARLAKRPGARMTYSARVLLRHRKHRTSLSASSINSVGGGLLKVFDKISRRDDLTPGERQALEQTVALRSASVELERGKARLLDGDFTAAASSIAAANDYFRSRKLRLILFWLRVAPRLLQRLYKLRVT
ncbi:MAG TPA: glycosyltransferase family 2 protein [Pyrinomonadaceae bacterium]|nr:glycosyltransferase family 2 protein [Pyrinomonadaceae bacterium]